MTDKASDGLPYGHFGAAFYHGEESGWNFARETESVASLRAIAESTTIAKAVTKASKSTLHNDSKDAPSRHREKQAKALIQSLPELQPAADLLTELARISEAVEGAVSQHDSSVGQLLALGKVYDESRRDYVDAIAFPAGLVGSDLRVVQGLKQRQGWGEDRSSRSSWIETFSFTGEEATWKGPGVSILSIVFAQPLETGEHYLTVRLPAEILIFRPVFRRHANPGHSRLHLDILFTISNDETGGSPHADVTFNPWYTGQLAIVDTDGSWSVWETGRKSRLSKKLRSGLVGKEAQKIRQTLLDDGWTRAAWVESTSTLCIATRRQLVLVDLEAADELGATTIDIGIANGLGWVLDMAALPMHLNFLLVLTSNHILVYRVGRSSDRQLEARVVLQLRHHRNPEDVSLRMALGSAEDNILVILRSTFHPTMDQYSFDVTDQDQIRLQHPQSLILPPTMEACDIASCLVKDVPLTEPDDDMDASQSSVYWYFYLLGKDMVLTQTLCASAIGRRQEGLMQAPNWVKAVTKAVKKHKLVHPASNDENQCRPPVSHYMQRRRHTKTSRSTDDWTINHELVIRQLNNQKGTDGVGLEEVVEEVTSVVHQPAVASIQPTRTLREIAGGPLDVEDVDGASEGLAGLRLLKLGNFPIKIEDEEPSQENQYEPLHISYIAGSGAMNLLGLDQLRTLSSAAEVLKRDWIAPTEGSLTVACSAARNHHAKRLAAELVLASQVLRTVSGETNDVAATQSQGQTQTRELSVRPTPLEDHSQDAKLGNYGTQRLQSPALPTPSASASTITGSSYPLGTAAPEIGRLSKYTTFAKDAPSALPRALNKVLAHWTIGGDPAEYDWRASNRHISRREEEADEDEMTAKEREHIRRRTERYMRRQRREAEESQRMQIASSQAPALEVVGGSQPVVGRGEPGGRRAESQVSAGAATGSSQSYGFGQSQLPVASQVVSGRHGGRPPVRKKRKSGF